LIKTLGRIYEFRFDDGSVIMVVHTEKHIEFNDRLYESLMLPTILWEACSQHIFREEEILLLPFAM